MSAAERSWVNRELFSEKIAELRAQGYKVTTWDSETTGYKKAVFVREGRVMLLEQWERVTVYGDNLITHVLDISMYERGHRPNLVCEVH